MSEQTQNDERVFIYGIEEIFRHPDFSPVKYSSDIALLKLNDTVKFNEYIYPICLPTTQSEDSKAIIAGFGSVSRHTSVSNDLLKATVEKFSNSECKDIFRNKRIDESLICYGNHSGPGGSCRVSIQILIKTCIKIIQHNCFFILGGWRWTTPSTKR